jgi:hypothetical protein
VTLQVLAGAGALLLAAPAALLFHDSLAWRLAGWLIALVAMLLTLPLFAFMLRRDWRRGVVWASTLTIAVGLLVAAGVALLVFHAWGLALWITR